MLTGRFSSYKLSLRCLSARAGLSHQEVLMAIPKTVASLLQLDDLLPKLLYLESRETSFGQLWLKKCCGEKATCRSQTLTSSDVRGSVELTLRCKLPGKRH